MYIYLPSGCQLLYNFAFISYRTHIHANTFNTGGIETKVNMRRIKKKIMNFRQGCQHTWKAESCFVFIEKYTLKPTLD